PRGLISPSQRGIPLSKISPAFLHANSTSHTWVFSAFAEIIDNAYDPDVSASELLIDKVDIRNVACLIFLDNGAGMDRDKLHKMLSFGFCEKDIFESSASHQPIGHYGNGFKSGSMRIGTDALVFTRSEHSASIGFLSQTYLNAIKAESVFVPILDYRLPKLERFKSQESRNNLNAILTYSVFKFEEELKAELRALEGSKTGTKIIISNLKRLENGNLELDFSSDPTDVRCPEAHEADMTSVYHRPVEQYTSEYKLSLREYCSILFLKPRMKITIRGHRVKSKLISKSLSQSEQDTYNPSWLANPVKIIFGFTCDKEKSEDYGLMLYHRNRLIKAFERVGYQKQPNDRGVGVVGVAQVDFLQPIHNKQDFKWDEKFNSVMKAFAIKLNEYWNEKMNTSNSGSSQNLPDWTWAQCDHCLKWRRLPDSINPESLPEKWYCRYNTDGTHNRCDIPEEPEDEDMAVKPRFEKTFKKRQEEQKRQLRMRQIEEEAKKKQEMEKRLRQKEEELKVLQQLKQPVVDPRAHELEQALAQAQKYIEEQARLMEQMSSGVFPTPPPPSRKGQQNGSKNRPLAQSLPVSPMHHNQQTKKRATVESLPTKENKKLCIKTETGEVLAITRNFGDDEEAADDLPNTTVTKKTPKSKQGTKGDPLRVAMPFHVSKTNQNLEKQKDGHVLKSKQSSATASNSADKTPAKSSKSKTSNGDVNFIDLTDDDEISKQPAIKQDPDAVAHDTSSTHGARQDSLDVKPDKASLDKQLTDITHEGLGEQEVAAAELSSLSQTDSNCANEQPRNISQTIESNLETALAAIKERADKEKLGTDAEEDKATASADSSPCSRPLPIIRGSSSAQTEKSVPNGPAETSQKTKAGESNSSVEETLLEKDCSSHGKENIVSTNSDETSKKTTEVLELSVVNDDDSDGLGNADQEVDDVEMENLEVACNKDPGCKVNGIKNNGDSCKDILTSSEMDSKDGPVPNGDINVHTSSSNKSHKQCSIPDIPDSSGDHRQARSGLEQSCESSTRSTAESPRESQSQKDQLQASPTSNRSVPEAEKSLVSNAAPSPGAYANTPSNILDSSSQNNMDKMVSCEKSNISDKNISLSDQTPLTSAQQETFKEGFEIVEESDAAEEDRVKSISIITQEKTSHSVHVPTDVAKTRTNYANEESPQAALDKMRKNVYRLLQLLVPGKDLGDISNIDKLVEDMVRDEESSSQSKCLSGSSHHESASS
ncbi:hypothetical protein EGW08_011116, partial [Elysia chlorotica]